MDFLRPELFNNLIWAVIFIGGALAILRLIKDLTGPPRWPDDRSGPPGPSEFDFPSDHSAEENEEEP